MEANASRTNHPPRWKTPLLVGASLAVVLLTATACASGSVSSTTTTPAASGSSATTVAAPTVRVASRGSYGTVLVDQSGMTLYTYAPDGTGKSVCTGNCATLWPPVTVPAGTAKVVGGTGIADAKLGKIARPDGTLQVTYDGRPVYRYSGDAKVGDTTGQGVGGVWFVVPVSTSPSASTTTSARAAGGGY